ncbi:hypothetical protein CDAR_291151 [Caerostris darwini]|uniref:Uncharacterized protein n=1 Tax=Caerostris darwini TaxID=1538125 RepID=A0AAV4RN37_9ARAC|nr:hypothetical protein CDAR_291151 [Caerostris darwini]
MRADREMRSRYSSEWVLKIAPCILRMAWATHIDSALVWLLYKIVMFSSNILCPREELPQIGFSLPQLFAPNLSIGSEFRCRPKWELDEKKSVVFL